MRTIGCIFVLALMVGASGTTAGQPAPATDGSPPATPSTRAAPEVTARTPGEILNEASLYYVAEETVFLYNRSDSTAPTARLPMRTPVTRLGCSDSWCQVQTEGGRTGYLHTSMMSNVWIRVSKENRRVYLYEGAELVHTFQADLGYNSFADKKRRGGTSRRDHWRTPEGRFYVVHKNPRSEFYKALVLNYPTVEDARRGLENDLISRHQYQAIEQAQEEHRIPPMNTALGGWIEIHGDGTGKATTWTQGCVAVQNRDMNVLWSKVRVGTPVLVE